MGVELSHTASSNGRLRTPSESSSALSAPDLSRPDPAFVAHVPIGFARAHGLLGLQGEGDSLLLAMAGDPDAEILDALGRFLDRPLEIVSSEPQALSAAIDAAYAGQARSVDHVVGAIERPTALLNAGAEARHDLLDAANRTPVVELVNLILFEAVKQEASDVHLQPGERTVTVRFRLDGVLHDLFQLPKAGQEELTTRLKVMGKMDIAEKRLPQDGRATVQIGQREIDLRIASLPTTFGERVVIRLLDKSARLYRLHELGMDGEVLTRFRRFSALEHGLVLVTGPTGSGKSTTLYGLLLEMDRVARNVLTLEDPVEYQLPGVNQTQINTKKGMTFASGLRSLLRQDPDVIMLGEIRDRETATMAIQSSLTGHLVLSTLHTNDAASAVARLLDLGIEPYLVASSVVAVLAQRLVRSVCSGCATTWVPSPRERVLLQDAPLPEEGEEDLRVGGGCNRCRGTGLRGRVGVFELLEVDDAIRDLIHGRASAAAIKAAAVEAGMRSLRVDGVIKVRRGRTTLGEIDRVTSRGGTD